MTDLINRLGASCYLAFEDGTNDYSAAQEAIDRIEQLENSLAWYQKMDAMCSDHVVELTDKLEAAETKLTKAVEMLRSLEIAATGAGVPHPQERKLLHEQIALTRAALAELEGKDHG